MARLAKPGQFKPGNQASLKHGGRAAENAVTYGTEFTGVAKNALAELDAEYSRIGPLGIVEERAKRQQVVADLFWAALLGSADKEGVDVKLLMTYADKFAYHNNNASRIFLAVEETRRKHRDASEPIDLSMYREESKPDAPDS